MGRGKRGKGKGEEGRVRGGERKERRGGREFVFALGRKKEKSALMLDRANSEMNKKDGYRQRNVRQLGTPYAHGTIAVNVTWMKRGCLSNASQHVPIYLQPFPSNSTRKFKGSPV